MCVAVIPLGLWIILNSSAEDAKAGFVGFASELLHRILQSPELRKDAESYTEIAINSVKQAVRESLGLKRRAAIVVSKEDFSGDVSTFAHAVISVLTSSGRCTEGID